jgi:hypothetical protein
MKLRYMVRLIRGGDVVYQKKRTRDLLVWRGQSVLAYLISQGAVGTSTSVWKVIASSNNTTPNMSDDSGNPEANEFSPSIGTPIAVSYTFEPTNKPSATSQVLATLKIQGTIISSGISTLRKIGIIDNVATPNRHIIVEDAVIPVEVITNDELEITYFIPLG